MDEGIAIKSKTRSKSAMNLGDASAALDKLVVATNSGTRTDCIKQILFQLERVLERNKGKRFVFGDITINRQ